MTKDNKHKIVEKYIKIKDDISLLEQELAETKGQLISIYEENQFESFEKLSVIPIAARTTVAWKKVAETLKPSDELIEENTTTGKPSFQIRIAKVL